MYLWRLLWLLTAVQNEPRGPLVCFIFYLAYVLFKNKPVAIFYYGYNSQSNFRALSKAKLKTAGDFED